MGRKENLRILNPKYKSTAEQEQEVTKKMLAEAGEKFLKQCQDELEQIHETIAELGGIEEELFDSFLGDNESSEDCY